MKKTSAGKTISTAKIDTTPPTDNSADAIYREMTEELFRNLAKFPEVATAQDLYMALAYAVRARLMHRWIHTARTYFQKASRTVIYLSAEYLMGPQLGNNLVNLGIYDEASKAVGKFGHTLDELLDKEEEPGLGNGGLGRLAACYLDSMATLEVPAIGYGIRYEYGIFDQEIRDGWQVEVTDKWLKPGNPWEISHPEIRYQVKLGGHTEPSKDENGRYRVRWVPDRVIEGTPFDTAILGYRVPTSNILRLWKADASETFDFQAFNVGNYYQAIEQKVKSENITRVLYPNDKTQFGLELRLEQEYFFVSCSLQDMIRIYGQRGKDLHDLHKKYAVQLNDTHPAIGVAELMRLLVDEHGIDWDDAWETTTKTFAYTNHTLLPEALERWPLSLFNRLLPRHTEIIFEINRRFLEDVQKKYPGDNARLARMSLIEEGGEKQVRMANLACVGSCAINGVAALHTELLKKTVLSDFHDYSPKKFSNKTNGVTPRRFMVLANPGLTKAITKTIGDGWVRNLDELRNLEKYAGDAAFQDIWRKIKRQNKVALAKVALDRAGVAVDPDSLFDIQVKRIHEYKRQHLNVLHIISLYNRIRKGLTDGMKPRTFFFGGKAAPGYHMAKLIIKLINSVAEVVNGDPLTKGLLRVVFLRDFNVKNAQKVYPAADLSEQISTAGKEASGTGNMKFALNGALTIGTLDGANVEIREAVGNENFFLFGLTADEVTKVKSAGYRPYDYIKNNDELREVMEMISYGTFSKGDCGLFDPLVRSLMERDEYLLFADFASYAEAQRKAVAAYGNARKWTQMSILNVARSGKFSSDRAIDEYCRDIWHVKPVKITDAK